MLFRDLVLALVVLVPSYVSAVAAIRGERVVFLIKCKRINRVTFPLFLVFVLCAMALKTEVKTLALIWFCEVVPVHSTSAFDRANNEPFAIAKAADRCRGEFQRRFGQINRVPVLRRHILLKVPDVDVPILMSGHKKRPCIRHIVNWHCDVRLADLLE